MKLVMPPGNVNHSRLAGKIPIDRLREGRVRHPNKRTGKRFKPSHKH